MAAGRERAAASRAAAVALAGLTPARRWAREHLERERRLGIGRRGGRIVHHRDTEDTEKDNSSFNH